ncbi:MAG: hypothetical protein AAFO95_19730 [Cyanobacteria bacterium J06600_6]
MKINWLWRCTSTIGFCLALTTPAWADQCSYVSKEQAINAIARLNLNDKIYFLCELCGEDVPESAQIKSLSMKTVDYEDYWQVEINGEGIDLAYVFADSGIESNFANLAMLADCPAEGVSSTLPSNRVAEPESARDYYERD